MDKHESKPCRPSGSRDQRGQAETPLYLGGYTSGGGGICRAVWRNERIEIIGFTEAVNPSYLARRGERLYAVRETRGGGVASYQIIPDGTLAQTGTQPTNGDAPCHLIATDRHLFVSNYTSGSLAIYDLDAQGALSSPPRVIEHTGSSEHVTRQRSAHVHQALITPDGQYLAVCDLGMDAVCFYPLGEQGLQEPPERVYVPAGSGPRHAAYGASGIWYVLCELSCELMVYRGYGASAKLLRRENPLPDASPARYGAALRLSPNGELLLASIRGADLLVLWDVMPDGELMHMRRFDALGSWPRDAAFTPDGRYVLCACEKENRVTAFALRDGGLVALGDASVPSPTCICF